MILLIAAALLSYFVEPPVPTTLVYPPFGHCMGIYRAGTEQLAMLLGGLVRFDRPQGLACVKLREWDSPGSADDDELAVYGVNSGSGHIIYNADMYTLGLYGGSGSGTDELLEPHGIAADPSGLVIVADTGNERVAVLQRNGSRLVPRTFIKGDLLEPWDVAIDGSGRIYVSDREGDMIYIYDSFSDSLPETIGIEAPTGIDAVADDRWFHEDEDRFIVAVANDATSIVKIEDGQTVAQCQIDDFGGTMLNYPAIDFWGNVWVTDSISCCIHKFDDQLQYICSYGTCGHGDREFWYPTGIAIWKRYGQVFVAEREGARYFWIGADLLDLEIQNLDRGVVIGGVLTEDALVDGMLYDSGGEMVCRLAEGRYYAGDLVLEWDGTDARGLAIPGGDYELELTIQPVYSSKGYFTKTFTDDITLGEAPVDTTTGRGDRF